MNWTNFEINNIIKKEIMEGIREKTINSKLIK
jgi:hypothetical protein